MTLRKIDIDSEDLIMCVVDDITDAGERLIELFEVIGYTEGKITVYNSPKQASEKIDNSTHLVFMDIRMIEQDGYETTRQLREKGYTNLIFGLTGDYTQSAIEEAVEAGMDEVLEKPFDLDRFNDLLTKYDLDRFIMD